MHSIQKIFLGVAMLYNVGGKAPAADQDRPKGKIIEMTAAADAPVIRVIAVDQKTGINDTLYIADTPQGKTPNASVYFDRTNYETSKSDSIRVTIIRQMGKKLTEIYAGTAAVKKDSKMGTTDMKNPTVTDTPPKPFKPHPNGTLFKAPVK